MIKVAALTSGRKTPSARFRVRQHLDILQTHNIFVDEYIPIIDKGTPIPFWPKSIKPRYFPPVYLPWLAIKAITRMPGLIGSMSHDVTWLQRELIPGLYTVERFLKKPLVFDVDDAIWTVSMLAPQTNQAIARKADVVVAGNQYLANWYSDYNNNVIIIPTAIDPDRFKPTNHKSDKFIIGWTGTYSNLPYLEAIEPALKRIIDEHSDIIIHVVCDKQPNFPSLDVERVIFTPWTPENEVSSIQKMTVGLMPLPDDKWTRGKCSFKMLQYMSCSIPVIASPVGMNADVLNLAEVGFSARDLDDWYEYLKHYYLQADAIAKHGETGRSVIESTFSTAIISKKLAEIFSSVV